MAQSGASFRAFLILLFAGTLSNSATMPFIGYYLVSGLHQPPWMFSVYSGLVVVLAVTANRLFGRRIDAGRRVFPLAGIPAAGFTLASLAAALAPGLWIVMTLGVLGFGIAATASSTMFSLGGHIAAGSGVPRERANATMRATMSAAWILGPATSFLLASRFGPQVVFQGATLLGLVWLALWLRVLPRAITAPAPLARAQLLPGDNGLWLAAGFVFCLGAAHALVYAALPLFLTQEVGLPDYAPGAAFSVKTMVEVVAIFSSPWLIARFGLRLPLLGIAVLAVVANQVMAEVASLSQMVLASALEGLYFGLFASLGVSYVQGFARDRPAQATAVYWNTMMISGLAGMPAAGLIAQFWDFRTAILVASGVAALSILVLALGSRRGRVRS